MKKWIINFSIAATLLGLFVVSASNAQNAVNAEPAQEATVIFYRQNDDGGKGYALTMQNTTVVTLEAGNFAAFRMQPGKHYMMADPKSDQVFILEVEAGKTYYVRAMQGDRVGINSKKPALKLAAVSDFESVKTRLADVSPKSGESEQASR